MDFKCFYFNPSEFNEMMTFVDSVWDRIFNVTYTSTGYADGDPTVRESWCVRVVSQHDVGPSVPTSNAIRKRSI